MQNSSETKTVDVLRQLGMPDNTVRAEVQLQLDSAPRVIFHVQRADGDIVPVLSHITEQNTELRNQLASSSGTIAGQAARNKDLEERCKQLQQRITSLETASKQLREISDVKEKRIQELQQRIQELRQRVLDLETRGPAEAQAAINAQRVVPQAEQPSAVTNLEEMAWGLIANVGGGDWSKESSDWQQAAARWRDEYHASLKRARETRHAQGQATVHVTTASIGKLVDDAAALNVRLEQSQQELAAALEREAMAQRRIEASRAAHQRALVDLEETGKEMAEVKANYDRACKTIAAMHAAAHGGLAVGSSQGVVEDVTALNETVQYYRFTIDRILFMLFDARDAAAVLPDVVNILQHAIRLAHPSTKSEGGWRVVRAETFNHHECEHGLRRGIVGYHCMCCMLDNRLMTAKLGESPLKAAVAAAIDSLKAGLFHLKQSTLDTEGTYGLKQVEATLVNLERR